MNAMFRGRIEISLPAPKNLVKYRQDLDIVASANGHNARHYGWRLTNDETAMDMAMDLAPEARAAVTKVLKGHRFDAPESPEVELLRYADNTNEVIFAHWVRSPRRA